ncbi:gamma-secretase subunit Aph-1 [Eupeodes corollae]|uniref:gamma-secretase subunit Aph-1 n=1 Tax=Eupeodes corollae TaxID=290404 RepID=UPI0024917BAE|nr:gamma-secretase subunit Aph-1 [Eupeodes corollae]
MTLAEFFGCTLIAFGPALHMFIFTIAHDPVRIIILIAAAFFWLLSLLISSLLWFSVVPLREHLAFGVTFSILFQECFRYFIYKILRSTENGLREVADDSRVTDNKHILAYVSGLGFGIISAAFALVNVLADMTGPATMGLKGGTQVFFVVSAAQALSVILLHTFWSVIFFNAMDTSKYLHIAYVICTHLLVSGITLLNAYELYATTLIANFCITLVTGLLAFNVAGGSMLSFKRFITCR